MRDFIGVILAGGQSSRMGRDKAVLPYDGKRLVDVMAGKLRAADACAILVSGKVDGYDCVEDRILGQGPAAAIVGMVNHLASYKTALFVPVDVPRLSPSLLARLAGMKTGGFYRGHPLPFSIPILKLLSLSQKNVLAENLPVHRLLSMLSVEEVLLRAEDEPLFLNVNTPEEYEILLSG